MTEKELSGFIWNIKEIIRDVYDDTEVEDVILPFTLLRRLDCVLEPIRADFLNEWNALPEHFKIGAAQKYLLPNFMQKYGVTFFNFSGLTLESLLAQPALIADNFNTYLQGYTSNVKEILANFVHQPTDSEVLDLSPLYRRLNDSNILFQVIQAFVQTDLSIEAVDNQKMGTIYEDVIRRSKETTNTKAGQFYTPRDVVRLLVALTLSGKEDDLKVPGKHFSIYDPACGTGGMLTAARDYIVEQSGRGDIKVYLYGQELSEKTYAICKADLLMKGDSGEIDKQIFQGSTLSNDQLPNNKFNFMLANPPFGVDWSKEEEAVKKENKPGGRFEAGLPSTTDGSLLFLQHMISKMDYNGSRIGIVLNGSPLFNGDAGSGWSNIRKSFLDSNLLDAIIALPKNIFYGTDIVTYLWILDNKRPENRRNKVLFINADDEKYCGQLQRSLGKKRYEITPAGIEEILSLYRNYETTEHALLIDYQQLLYTKVVIDRPLRYMYKDIVSKFQSYLDSVNPKLTDKKRILLESIANLPSVDEPRNDASFFAFLKANGIKCTQSDVKLIRSTFATIDEDAPEVHEKPLDKNSNLVADTNLRDAELVPATEDFDEYFAREVLPFAPDAWADRSKDKVGCEFPFTKLFYKYEPARPIETIVDDLKKLEEASAGKLAEFIKNV